MIDKNGIPNAVYSFIMTSDHRSKNSSCNRRNCLWTNLIPPQAGLKTMSLS